MDDEVVDAKAPAEETAHIDEPAEGTAPPPEGPLAYISLSVRLSVEDHARMERLAQFAYTWNIIKRPSLAEIIRFGLALAEQHLAAVYLKKKGGG